ncbi:MAG: DUF4833 domain-containing protein [Sphingobacteriia bacterium]|nr:DUF4833 domain-containing protein [Sphingobacteriia bacterium]
MKFYLPLLFFFLVLDGFSQGDYPVPPQTSNQLFYIQHSKNHNTYVYDANLDGSQKLHEKEPVNIYRIIYTEGGIKKDLTNVQRKLAYGLHTQKIADNYYEMYLVSYPGIKLYLRQNHAGKTFVETVVNKQTIILKRLFLKTQEGLSDLRTKLLYVLVYGKDLAGNNIVAKLIP